MITWHVPAEAVRRTAFLLQKRKSKDWVTRSYFRYIQDLVLFYFLLIALMAVVFVCQQEDILCSESRAPVIIF